MRKTTFVLLIAAAAAASGAVVFQAVRSDEAAIAARSGELFLPDLQRRANEAREVVLTRSSGTATLKQQGDRWIFVEKGDYPANGEQVRRVLVELAELRLVEAKTRKAELYPRLQVEDVSEKDARSTQMTVKDGKGTTIVDVLIGRRRIDRLGAAGIRSTSVARAPNRRGWPPATSTSPASSSGSWSVRCSTSRPSGSPRSRRSSPTGRGSSSAGPSPRMRWPSSTCRKARR